MKKTLIALAAVAAATGAMAQATISGTYSFSYQTDLTAATPGASGATSVGSVAGTTKAKGLAVTDANFRIAATEDLGGGLRASADMLLETGHHRGAAVTRADSGIAVSGAFGSVALRNTRQSDLIAGIASTAISLPDSIYDSTGVLSRSAIDTLAYTSPEIMPGLRASLTYVEGNDGAQATPASNTSSYVLGVNYAQGPLSVAFAYKAKPQNAAAGVKASNELSIRYNFGVATVAYAFDGASTAAAVSNVQTHKSAQGVSVTVPMGAVSVGVNYFKRGDAKLTEVGAKYDFSKRTSLTVSSGTKKGLTAAGFNGTQNRVRLMHTF